MGIRALGFGLWASGSGLWALGLWHCAAPMTNGLAPYFLRLSGNRPPASANATSGTSTGSA